MMTLNFVGISCLNPAEKSRHKSFVDLKQPPVIGDDFYFDLEKII